MVYLFFTDQTIYERSKYTIMLTCHQITQEPIIVEIQYIHPDSNWHSGLPTERELKQSEEEGQDISFWTKYRKWQKRKEYTLEEFNKTFEIKY
jgi:hypothetical protein